MGGQLRLLLTVEGRGDLVAEVGDGATVSELVAVLGGRPGAEVVVTRTGQRLDGGEPLVGSDLRSGDRIALVAAAGPVEPAGLGPDRSRTWRPAAVLKLLSGPSAPAAIEIAFGETTIGRGPDNDVVVADDGMSRLHASIVIDDDTVEIIDRGSHNGVVVDGEVRRGPTTLTPGVRALLGRTWIEVDHLRRPAGLDDRARNTVAFNRPPRLVRPYEPSRFELPVPPEHPGRQRIPKTAAIAPLVMGGALIYLPVIGGGRPNYLFGLFMLLSPVMLLGSFFENRSGARADFRAALSRFDAAVADVTGRLERAHAAEREGRLDAAPPAADLQAVVETLSPRLWERDLNEPDALSVRIGLADQPSMHEIELHDRGPADLRRPIEEIPERFSVVRAVPAVASLRHDGGVGLSGPREYTVPLCYSVVAQLVTQHSPADLLVAAMVPAGASDAWEWLKWLPHCPSGPSPLGVHQLAADELACRSLLARLLSFIDGRLAGRNGYGDQALAAPAVVVVIGEGVAVEQHELTRLLETGPAAGVFAVWVAGASRRVPRPIGTVVQVDAGGATASLGVTGRREVIDAITIETMDREQATALARRLSPIEDVSSRFASASQIPSRVSLVDLLGGPGVLDDPEAILTHWRRRPKTLEAPVGRLADRVFTLDIRRDGPHALVGGTTGAGKSEFLQSWVLSLAATHSPATVTFLLVDYKGGAAFKDCSRLPHTVGMVTDLDRAGVRRALVSLGAELRRREELLAHHDCSDLLAMIDKRVPDTPPSLLIIVDEFAALAHEVPEFVDGMVGVAQRGRSLGLHLVLATQRPAGIITGQVKSNTDLRIALRMADAEDSSDVIDVPLAADIDRATPGRAIARISRDRFVFQSAYVGAVSGPGDDGPGVELAPFRFEGVLPVTPARADGADDGRGAPAATDLERLVEQLCRIHAATGEPAPRKPWLAPLAPLHDLNRLPPPGGDDRLVLGLVDVPESQAQVPLHFEPDADGSLGIVGAGRSGKTVALRTICAAAARHDRTPHDVPQVYGLDFAGRGLRLVEELPHVGGVAYDDDPERVRRVLSDIEHTVDRRIGAFSSVRAASVPEYRRARPGEPTPRVYLLIDGYPAFHELFEPVENERWVRLVRRLILEGPPVGVHVVLTASRREAVHSTTARAVGRWLILRQTSPDDYRSLDVAGDVLGDKAPPGRAVERDNVAQLAILGGDPGTAQQADAIGALGRRLVAAGVVPAPPIRVLPTEVTRAELADPGAVGLRDRDFGEHRLPDPFRVFLVSGPRASGRSTALVSIGRALGSTVDEVVFLAPKPPAVAPDPWWRVAVGHGEIDEVIHPLLSPGPGPRRLVLVDDAYGLIELGVPVDQLAEACDGIGLRAVFVLEDTRARSGYDPFARSLTAPRQGLLLRPNPVDDADIYGMALPRVRSHLWPAGRGYVVDQQTIEVIQIAR